MSTWSWWRVLMGVRTVVLETPLTPKESFRRLRAEVDETEAMFGRQAVVGSFEGDKAEIRLRNGGPNAYSTVLRIQFKPSGSGAVLICETGTGPLGLGLLKVWIAGLTLLWAAMLANILYGLIVGPQSELDIQGAIVGPPALIIFSAAIGATGRFVARPQDQFLVQFAANNAEAKRGP